MAWNNAKLLKKTKLKRCDDKLRLVLLTIENDLPATVKPHICPTAKGKD